jgi:Raf kinase inhibitor-like YbhB/YbcL family protein
MEDPDAPGGTFTHWLVWNIDPATTMLGEGARIEGATQGINSAGKTGYIGPCPPSGIHHYHFKLYALDAMLDLSPRAGKGRLEEEIGKHLITFAEIVGVYQRK